MGIKDVGTENLPNVYIDSIVVSPPTLIRVRCLIKDDKEIKTWRNRNELRDLTVRISLFHDVSETGTFTESTLALNSGQESLSEYSEITMEAQKTYFTNAAFASDFVPLQTADSMGSDEVFYFKTFEFRSSVGLPYVDQANNITVYAACYLSNLQFDNEIFNKFYGPMASEKIIIGGSVNTTSGYFFNPETNEEYGGPVHEHNGVYMEGSFHTDRPHAVLRYVVEPNNKITVE